MNTLITNIGQLVTPQGREPLSGPGMSVIAVEERVEVLISGGRITSIGKAHSRDGIDLIIDADGGVVLPGLVDPHVHVLLPPGIPERRRLGEGELGRRLARGIRRAIGMGTTTIEVKCGSDVTPGDGIPLLKLIQELKGTAPIRLLPTFLGSLERCEGTIREDRVSALISEVIPTLSRRRLVQFCDVVCGDGGYTEAETRTILRAARGASLRAKIHIAGTDREIGRLGAELEVTSIDHLFAPAKRDIDELKRAGVIPVLLPGTAFLLDWPYPEARRMIDSGLPIAIGTDSGLGGYGVGSMWSVISLAVKRLDMSLEEGISAATLNGAAAVDLAGEIGSIEPGKLADLVILDIDDYREIGDFIGLNPVKKVIFEGSEVLPG